MNLTEMFHKGMVAEEKFRVEEGNSAIHVGSGGSRVLATPLMIAFMERVAHRMLAGHLPVGTSSVGVLVDIRHIAPTPVGNTVHVRAEIIDLEGTQVTFAVQAWDETEKIGSGRHERAVIDEARFLKRVESKKV